MRREPANHWWNGRHSPAAFPAAILAMAASISIDARGAVGDGADAADGAEVLPSMTAPGAREARGRGRGAPAEPTVEDLMRLSLRDLMDVPIDILRGGEPLSHAAAAVTVITSEDIRRSGVTSIPDALRMVPGVHVARTDSHTWAVGSRGFTDVFSNKLLVMIDGRTVYTPLFSGVFWDVNDTVLEDVERIEMIRGPGATLWGANAVNGVVNIVTKHSLDTQGVLLSGGGGTFERAFATARYGFRLNDETSLRVYGKYFQREAMPLDRSMAGIPGDRDWEMSRGGFRLDWEPGDRNRVLFQTELYGGSMGDTFFVPTLVPPAFTGVSHRRTIADGGHLLGRWTHWTEQGSEMSLQTSFDWSHRDTVIFREDRKTVDLDFQHSLELGERHQVVWGLGYRHTRDDIVGSALVTMVPGRRSDDLFSAFVQDEIALAPDRLRLTLGSKFEHNDYTGFEWQPGVRILWTPSSDHSVWASASRALRAPARADSDVMLNPPGAPIGMATLWGNPDFRVEKLMAYEIGYRVKAHERVTFDLAGFYNVYDDLRTLRFTATPPQTMLANDLEGETYGFEAASSIELIKERWRLHGGYSLLRMNLRPVPGAPGPAPDGNAVGLSPRHQIFLRSSANLSPSVEFDTMLRYVDNLPTQRVPSYFTLDARLAWKMCKNAELAIVGQNLIERRHAEFRPTSIPTPIAEVPRSVYVKLTLQF